MSPKTILAAIALIGALMGAAAVPADIVFVIDSSADMQDHWNSAKTFCKSIVNNIKGFSPLQYGIVIYDNKADTPLHLSSSYDSFDHTISNLAHSDSACSSPASGLYKAVAELITHQNSNAVQFIILISNSMPSCLAEGCQTDMCSCPHNASSACVRETVHQARNAVAHGAQIISIGLSASLEGFLGDISAPYTSSVAIMNTLASATPIVKLIDSHNTGTGVMFSICAEEPTGLLSGRNNECAKANNVHYNVSCDSCEHTATWTLKVYTSSSCLGEPQANIQGSLMTCPSVPPMSTHLQINCPAACSPAPTPIPTPTPTPSPTPAPTIKPTGKNSVTFYKDTTCGNETMLIPAYDRKCTNFSHGGSGSIMLTCDQCTSSSKWTLNLTNQLFGCIDHSRSSYHGKGSECVATTGQSVRVDCVAACANSGEIPGNGGGSNKTGVAVGVTLSVLAVLAIGAGFYIYRRRQERAHSGSLTDMTYDYAQMDS